MAQKDRMESFIQGLFEQERGPLSRDRILARAEKAQFAPDVLVFFKELPEQEFDEESLTGTLNSIIDQRGRTEAVGGLLNLAEKAK